MIVVGDTERNPHDKMRAYMRDCRIPLAWRIDIPGRSVECWMPADPDHPTAVLYCNERFSFEGVDFAVSEIPALRA